MKNRDPVIKGLLSQQADVLRDYVEGYVTKPNVGVELPTGAGKTLIGLLIAEWRRETRNERVMYLCPTRQLANQVGEKAESYGLDPVVFLGSRKSITPGDIAAYQGGQKIAIAPYSRIFNGNPGIEVPNFLVLDDAHVAENYVGNTWSMTVGRNGDDAEIYEAIFDVIRGSLPKAFVERIDQEAKTRTKKPLELVQATDWRRLTSQVREAVNARIEGGQENTQWRWGAIHNNLEACNVFVSPWEILIRPLTPPALTHAWFVSANQRLYMSATLGRAGDLERMFGVKVIDRMKTPISHDKRGTGRRFFLFPEMTHEPEVSEQWAYDLAEQQSRSLILCRDHETAGEANEAMEARGVSTFHADDVEESLDTFAASDHSALVVASRFEGLDLAGDISRLNIINGLPDALGLQERFFLNRLGMKELMRDRIATRFTQAAGRCTRSDTDYSLVLPIGAGVLDVCSTTEFQARLHPEMCAEIRFGLAQSREQDLETLAAMAAAFFEQGEDWREIEGQILELRTEAANVPSDPSAKVLLKNASPEVEYSYALWAGDLNRAAVLARSITDDAGTSTLGLYRAWWAYQAGSCYHALWTTTRSDDQIALARKFYAIARGAAGVAGWYSNLPYFNDAADEPAPSPAMGAMVEGVQRALVRLGGRGPRFEQYLKETISAIDSDDADTFERGLGQLATLLGFEGGKPPGAGVPDSVWEMEGVKPIAWEAKSEETTTKGVSKKTCTEAEGHRKWSATNLGVAGADVIVIIATPQQTLDPVAKPYTGGLWYMDAAEVRTLAREATSVVRDLRNNLADFETEGARQRIQREMTEAKLDPESILARLTKTPLEKLPIAGDIRS